MSRSSPRDLGAPQQRIASALVVGFGPFGAISQRARQRGVCRRRAYREAAWVERRVEGSAWQRPIDRLRHDRRALQRRLRGAGQRLEQAVVLDEDKQAEFAAAGQAIGVSLPEVRTSLDVPLPGPISSVATPGRWTQAVAQKAGPLLAVPDAFSRPPVRQAVADDIDASQPVLRVVEPESLCWVAGRRLGEAVTGAAWAEEPGRLPALEQVTRAGGNCPGRGVADWNQRRRAEGRAAVADQLDPSPVLRDGGRGIGRAARAARGAFKSLEAAGARLAQCRRQGQSPAGCQSHLRAWVAKAERALGSWGERERIWQPVQAALQPVTPAGELNPRVQAEQRLADLLPQLPGAAFAAVKRQLQRPEVLTYLDEMQRNTPSGPPGCWPTAWWSWKSSSRSPTTQCGAC